MNAKWRITLALVTGLLAIAGTLLATESAQDNTARQNMTVAVALGNVIYVDQDAPGLTHNGLSWTTAYTDAQQALTAAISGTEIWVAKGIYYPGADVTSTFVLTNGVALYGGFAATETLRTQRDWAAHVTILSGDIDRNDITDANGVVTTTTNITGSNAYHVVYANNVSSTAVLDGFSITAGKTGESYPDNRGGGMFNRGSSPQIANMTFSGNQASSLGGGMYNRDNSSPTLTNVTFSGNQAYSGGGIYNNTSDPALTNVTFSRNQAMWGGGMYNSTSDPALTNVMFDSNLVYSQGGGIYNESSDPSLTNVMFSSNRADTSGGGMYNDQSQPRLTDVTFSGNQASFWGGGMINDNCGLMYLTNVMFSGNQAGSGGGIHNYDSIGPRLTNVTFSGNRADSGGGMFTTNSRPTLVNCILWGNSPDEIYGSSGLPTVTYSDVYSPTGVYSGMGNINADPLFIAPITATAAPTTTGNYRLLAGSPAIDAGNSLSVTVLTDLDGRPRIIDAAVDMGAYEFSHQYQVYLPLVTRN